MTQHPALASNSSDNLASESVPIKPVPSGDEYNLPSKYFLLQRQNDGFQIPFYMLNDDEISKIAPPAVVKTWEQRFAELTPTNQNLFTQFHSLVQQSSWYDAHVHDNWTCLRYLTSRSFDVQKALKMLAESTKWRTENKVDSWECDQCKANPNLHMSQFVGWDKQHRPVMYMSMRWGPERKQPLRHMICAFNHIVKLMPVGVEQWICITDFATYSHIHDSRPGMAMSVVEILQNHFPERLGKMICVNPPKMFSFFWKLVKKAVDPITRTKVELVFTDNKPSTYDLFPTLFPPHLCYFLYDSYERSKNNWPATPRIWYPRSTGYPANYHDRKAELKARKGGVVGNSSLTASESNDSIAFNLND